MNRMFAGFVMLLASFLAAGCATSKTAGITYTPGAVVETLSSGVSLSFVSADRGMAGSGYMVYRRPDNLRLLILSPFGTTVSDLFISGDTITVIDPSKETAFSGRIQDLPDTPEGRGWKLIRWVMDVDPPGTVHKDGGLVRRNRFGAWERAVFENGVLVEKSMAGGNEARFSDFASMEGVMLAREILVENGAGDRFIIRLKEPEVNGQLEADAFSPRLEGITVLPLSLLKGG